MTDKIKEAIDASGHRLGVLARSPGYEIELTRLYEAGHLAAQKEAAEQKPVAEVNSLNGCTSTTWKVKLADGKHNLYAAPINQSPVGYVAHGSTLQPSERVFAGCSILDAEEASDYLPECITQLYALPPDQSARIAELEAELSQLKITIDLGSTAYESLVDAALNSKWIPEEYTANDWLYDCAQYLREGRPSYEQLSAAQAENQKLRDALESLISHCLMIEESLDRFHGMGADAGAGCSINICDAKDALSTPSNNSALESLLEAERVKTAEACAAYVNRFISGDGILNEVWISEIEEAIRNGDWKGFVK